MKIVSWNVNGIRACSKKGFIDFVDSFDPDILCLQETKAHPEQLDLFLHNIGGRNSYFSAADRRGYSGTATYLKENSTAEKVKHGIGIKKFDKEGRFVVTEHKDFTIYNVYFPNGAAREERHLYKQDFLKKFTSHLKQKIENKESVIVLGDYNVAHLEYDVYDPVRLSKVSGFLPEEREWFSYFLSCGFIDKFRYFHPNEKDKYSWWSYRENARINNRGWRIDYICVSNDLKDRLVSASILDNQMGSDHCPVVLELED
jgi:exodeoxyribonuclease-3